LLQRPAMARKKIREYDSKRLLKAHIARLAGLQLPIAVAQVKENTNFGELLSGACCCPGYARQENFSMVLGMRLCSALDPIALPAGNTLKNPPTTAGHPLLAVLHSLHTVPSHSLTCLRVYLPA
jgi:hypothetical protein